jgi:hypothetical protein
LAWAYFVNDWAADGEKPMSHARQRLGGLGRLSREPSLPLGALLCLTLGTNLSLLLLDDQPSQSALLTIYDGQKNLTSGLTGLEGATRVFQGIGFALLASGSRLCA